MQKEIYGYIYMVKNLVNKKLYFGITVNDFNARYSGNIGKHTHNDHLKRSIEKYGIENFEINEQFDVAYTEDDLYELEDMYMCIYNTLDPKYGYNKRRSGSKYKGHGKMSEESKHKMSDSLAGEKHPNYGKHLSETTRTKIGEKQKGQFNHFYGKKHDEETKKKISEAGKRPCKEETKKKISEARKGKVCGKQIAKSKPVRCINTGEEFESCALAAKHFNIGKGAKIALNCKGKQSYAGKHPITGEKLHWEFV